MLEAVGKQYGAREVRLARGFEMDDRWFGLLGTDDRGYRPTSSPFG